MFSLIELLMCDFVSVVRDFVPKIKIVFFFFNSCLCLFGRWDFCVDVEQHKSTIKYTLLRKIQSFMRKNETLDTLNIELVYNKIIQGKCVHLYISLPRFI